MIAIPLSKKDSTVISDLYGNAPFFALLDMDSGYFSVCENEGCGNGLETASFIKKSGANSTIFYHMGEGIYNSLVKDAVSVFSCSKLYLTIDDIYRKFLGSGCVQVFESNKDRLLDSGTTSCSCECSNN